MSRRGTEGAIRTQQEVADILYRRGELKKPCRRTVRWAEQQALWKLRFLLHDLESELEDREGHARSPVVRVY